MGGGADLALEEVEKAGEELGDGTFLVNRVVGEGGGGVVEDGLGAEDDEGHVARDGNSVLLEPGEGEEGEARGTADEGAGQ